MINMNLVVDQNRGIILNISLLYKLVFFIKQSCVKMLCLTLSLFKLATRANCPGKAHVLG